MTLAFLSAFQQGAHPAIVALPQDGARLAAVRPLTMPEPPPLISSTKQGGSITQVLCAVEKALHFQTQWSKRCEKTALFCSSGHPRPAAQSSSWLGPWQDAPHTDGAVLDGAEESGWVKRDAPLLPRFRKLLLFTVPLFSFPPPGQQVHFLWSNKSSYRLTAYHLKLTCRLSRHLMRVLLGEVGRCLCLKQPLCLGPLFMVRQPSSWKCLRFRLDHTGVTWGQIWECTRLTQTRLKPLFKNQGVEFTGARLIWQRLERMWGMEGKKSHVHVCRAGRHKADRVQGSHYWIMFYWLCEACVCSNCSD